MLSALAATAFVVMVFVTTISGESALRALLSVMLPLTCVWYPDGVGRLTGISMGLGRPVITERTPGVFVVIGGWILLIAIISVWCMLRLH